MTDSERSDDGIDRRNVLKGATALGVGASAFAGAAAAHPKPHTITVKAVSHGATYRIEVSGEIAKGPEAGDTDEIRDGDVVLGRLTHDGRVDDFRFSGVVTEFEVLDGEVEVLVNGERVEDPEGLPKTEEAEKKDEERLPNHVIIEAEGEHVDYTFVVAGDVEAGPEADVSAGDEIEGDVVTGDVAGSGVDDYFYSGAIKFASTDGPVTVTLEIDQADH